MYHATRPAARGVILAVVAGVFAAACGDGPANPPPGVTPAMRLTPKTATDSIEAQLAAPLEVVLTGRNGRPAPGVAVRFAAEALSGISLAPEQGSGAGGYSLTVNTDANGRAAVRVRLGARPGSWTVAVAADALQLADSATYQVLAGAPASLALPADTGVYLGGSFTLAAEAWDRHLNPVTAITYSTDPQVSLANGVITGLAYGRGGVYAAAGALRDTLWVSVVPRGTLAATYGMRIVTLNLDGSERRVLVTDTDGPGPGPGIAWAPGGQELVAPLQYTRTLHRVGVDGTRVRLLQDQTGIGPQASPTYSRDGQWVYFGAGNCNANSILGRMRADGGAPPERISHATSSDCFEAYDANPSMSHDGTRIVYSYAVYGQQPLIRTMDLATRTVTALDVPGHRPVWSPTADEIAYVQGALVVMRSDGTGARTLSHPQLPPQLQPALAWSVDGAWLVVQAQDVPWNVTPTLHLVRVSDGLAIRLPYTVGMRHPAWRP